MTSHIFTKAERKNDNLEPPEPKLHRFHVTDHYCLNCGVYEDKVDDSACYPNKAMMRPVFNPLKPSSV